MNVDPSDSGANTQLRGQARQPSTRNYFPSSTTPGDYNVERLEGAAGPNAILYGVGGAGGQINYITKRARSYNFGRARKGIDPKLLSEMRPIRFKARDGWEIPGYLTIPIGRPATKMPMLVIPHGGPYGPRDVWGYSDDVQFFGQPRLRGAAGQLPR